jgi:hypothetical protein
MCNASHVGKKPAKKCCMLSEEILDENGAAYFETMSGTLSGPNLKITIFRLGDSEEGNYRTQHESKGNTWQEFKHIQEQQV